MIPSSFVTFQAMTKKIVPRVGLDWLGPGGVMRVRLSSEREVHLSIGNSLDELAKWTGQGNWTHLKLKGIIN